MGGLTARASRRYARAMRSEGHGSTGGEIREELLAGELALVTYRAARPANASGEAARQTLRSSLWLRRNGRWQIRFHQGTPIDEGAAGLQ